MEDHLEEMKGSEELARISADNGDFEKLKNMMEHGADILSFRDSASQDNTLLHFAVKNNNLQLLKFLKSLNGNFNVRNANGESALHLCCGQTANTDLAKFLVMCGASAHAKNALGDTPLTLAARFGHTDLVLLLNSSESPQTAVGSMNKTIGSNMFGSTPSASKQKPPTAYSPYHPTVQAQMLDQITSP